MDFRYYLQYFRTAFIIRCKQFLLKQNWFPSEDFTRFAILCQPRTGSTLLHTYLNSHTRIFSFDEILRRTFENTSSLPEGFVKGEIFKRYPRWFQSVGIKLFYQYERDKVFSGAFQEVVDDNSVHVIHLIRRDTLSQLASKKLAEQTGEWSFKSENSKPTKVRIPMEEFEDFKANKEQQRNEMKNLFQYHPMLEIFYEDLVENPNATLEAVQKFLNVIQKKLFTVLKKQNTKPLKDLIENFEGFIKPSFDSET